MNAFTYPTGTASGRRVLAATRVASAVGSAAALPYPDRLPPSAAHRSRPSFRTLRAGAASSHATVCLHQARSQQVQQRRVNSYVTNVNCRGITYSQRIDIPEVLAWIESFL